MDKYKKSIRISKIIYGSITIVCLIILIVGISLIFNKKLYDMALAIIISSTILLGIFLALFSCMFLINIKEYNYKGIKIGVYVGFEKHLLFINDEIIDEFICCFSLTPIKLSGKYLENTIEATVSIDNNVNLKVNGEMVRPNKKTN